MPGQQAVTGWPLADRLVEYVVITEQLGLELAKSNQPLEDCLHWLGPCFLVHCADANLDLGERAVDVLVRQSWSLHITRICGVSFHAPKNGGSAVTVAHRSTVLPILGCEVIPQLQVLAKARNRTICRNTGRRLTECVRFIIVSSNLPSRLPSFALPCFFDRSARRFLVTCVVLIDLVI